jgi:hypothetical protein
MTAFLYQRDREIIAFARLIEQRGRNGKVIDWLAEITADCPKKQAGNMSDQCAARCPDLPRVM